MLENPPQGVKIEENPSLFSARRVPSDKEEFP